MSFGISETTKTDVDYYEGLVNYLTLQLVRAGGEPIPPNEPLSIDIYKRALETINKELDKAAEKPPVPIKVVPQVD